MTATVMRTAQPVRVEFSVEVVTPDLARLWLDLNLDGNRRIRPTMVAKYAADMRSGGWLDNGETIKFDTNGNLIDGQHRLTAIIQTGETIELAIARNVRPDAYATVDTGGPRRFADVLSSTRAVDAKTTAALVRRVFLWDQGIRIFNGGGGGVSITHTQLLEHYESDVAGFRMAAARGSDVSKHTGLLNASLAATAFYLLARIDHVAAMEFTDRFITGANLGTGHPILALRQRLLRAKNVERLVEAEKLALTIRAWNYYRSRETCERLQIARGGLTSDAFPVPR